MTLGSGTKLTDSATLSGGNNPAGTITFYLFAPGVTPNGTTATTSTATRSRSAATAPTRTSMGNNPGGYAPTARAPTSGWSSTAATPTTARPRAQLGDEPETVNPAGPVKCGQFATIGFWHNCKSARTSIYQVHGDSSCKPWGTGWPRTSRTSMGRQCDKSNPCVKNLTNCTNAEVNSFYQNLCNDQRLNKTYAQIMATPWPATPPTLPGRPGPAPSRSACPRSTGGNGLSTCNVGSNGSA